MSQGAKTMNDRPGTEPTQAVIPVPLNEKLAASRLRNLVRADVELCFQCQKCASGCPVAYAMDYTPPQLLRMILLGMDDEVLGARTTWLCASCETCTTRCPQGIDIAGVMDGVREFAIAEGRRSPVPGTLAFFKAGVWNIRNFGRMYELGLIGMLKMKTREFTKDVNLGRKMFFRGKIKVLPIIRGRREIKKIFSRVKEKERGE